MWLKAVLAVILALNLSACATSKSGMVKDQVREMQAQIEEMAKELQEKDETINDLNKKLEVAARAKDVKTVNAKGTGTIPSKAGLKASDVNPKQIQAALKNAGYYQGEVDGKIGPKTKAAIKEFQKANGLKADGVVGKKTWIILAEYVDFR